jgi:prepilin-type processing-associated H-X9-DG protein
MGYHYGWAVQILPFLEQGTVYRHFDFRRGVYESGNETARTVRITTFFCPSDPRGGLMNFAGCHHDVEAPIDVNNAGVLYLNSHIRYDDITDGPACTVLLGEIRHGPSLGWASGTRATLRNTGHRFNDPDPTMPVVSPGTNPNVYFYTEQENWLTMDSMIENGILPMEFVGGFSSYHFSGVNFLFCDGSSRSIKNTVDLQVLRSLGNRADGSLISDDQY